MVVLTDNPVSQFLADNPSASWEDAMSYVTRLSLPGQREELLFRWHVHRLSVLREGMVPEVTNPSATFRIFYDESFYAQLLPEGRIEGPFDDFFDACNTTRVSYSDVVHMATRSWRLVPRPSAPK